MCASLPRPKPRSMVHAYPISTSSLTGGGKSTREAVARAAFGMAGRLWDWVTASALGAGFGWTGLVRRSLGAGGFISLGQAMIEKRHDIRKRPNRRSCFLGGAAGNATVPRRPLCTSRRPLFLAWFPGLQASTIRASATMSQRYFTSRSSPRSRIMALSWPWQEWQGTTTISAPVLRICSSFLSP